MDLTIALAGFGGHIKETDIDEVLGLHLYVLTNEYISMCESNEKTPSKMGLYQWIHDTVLSQGNKFPDIFTNNGKSTIYARIVPTKSFNIDSFEKYIMNSPSLQVNEPFKIFTREISSSEYFEYITRYLEV